MNELEKFFSEVQNANKGEYIKQIIDNNGISFIYENAVLTFGAGNITFTCPNNREEND